MIAGIAGVKPPSTPVRPPDKAQGQTDGFVASDESQPFFGKLRGLREAAARRDSDPLQTNWGYNNENTYNNLIGPAVAAKWHAPPTLAPIIVKSLIAQESGFNPDAESPAGYVGLMQLGTQEAIDQGLQLEPTDERTIPEKAVPAGLGILDEKRDQLQNPLNHFPDEPWAQKVHDYYQKHGTPSDKQLIYMALASYNGGAEVVMMSMVEAMDRHIDPFDWNTLIQPRQHPDQSPLYKGISQFYSPRNWLSKYREMSKYPIEIMDRAGQST